MPLASDNRPAALIFDVDGVIVHSTPVHNAAWQAYLRRFGMEVSLVEIEAAMLGRHNGEIVRHFFGPNLSEQEVKARGNAKEAVYRRMLAPEFARHLVPGIGEFVRRRRRYRLGVASNAEPENVRFVLEQAGLRDAFAAVVTGEDIERPKPYPDIYLKAARMLDVEPARCVVFEDSSTGVAAARAAGARVIGLSTSRPGLDGVEFCVPDFLDPRIEQWLAEQDRA